MCQREFKVKLNVSAAGIYTVTKHYLTFEKGNFVLYKKYGYSIKAINNCANVIVPQQLCLPY